MPQTTAQWRAEASADELAARAAEMRSEWATTSEQLRGTDKFDAARTQFLTEIEELDVNMTLRGIEAAPEALRGRVLGGDNGVPGAAATEQIRTPGDIVVANEAFSAWAKRAAAAGSIEGNSSPTVELRALIGAYGTRPEFRALVAEGDANGSATLLPVGQPYLVDQRRQRLFIRDLLGVQQTTLANIPYVRELNPVANALSASTVPEGALKPEATVQFTPDNAPVQVIATWIPITTQILEDGTTLVGYINGRLTYMLQIREELEVLKGTGTGADIKGILSYAGIQTQAAVSGEAAQTIANAIAKIELVDGYADGVAMNPADFWAMVTHRAAAGAGTFDAGAFTQAPIQYVWGLPVVRTNTMASKKALVGNFGMGATLFDRSQTGVRVFEQHADYAQRNQVMLRAEERVALAVNRPDFFVDTTLP